MKTFWTCYAASFFAYISILALYLIFFVWIYPTNAAVKVPYPYSEIEAGTEIEAGIYFNTYETSCSGYYIIDTTNKNKIKSIGYGVLADQYTYEIDPVIIDPVFPDYSL